MKGLRLIVLLVIFVSRLSARDFRPASHLEKIPLADSSIQECYVFQTTPGVAYTVEVSNNLSNWNPQDEIYGLGGEYAVTMHEFTPPPPPPPGNQPAVPPSLAANVSLRIQPASGPAGGSVVAWPSLDQAGPMIVRIAGEMDPAWNSIPIFWNRYEEYNFSFWHPGTPTAPPTENPPLGPKDTAMLAALEAAVPDINQQIAASIFQARNAPPPAPPDPDSKRFWRVKVDWSIDTDQDGSPDWAEFEIAARGTESSARGTEIAARGADILVPGVIGDAFNPDTNSDGVPDGQQLDADFDCTPDANDPDSSDNTATFPIGSIPRYALFPITNAQPSLWLNPFQISDKGTVLYRNGTWTGGVWTALNMPVEELETSGYGARGINDHNVILGIAILRLSDQYRQYEESGYCSWANPEAALSFVTTGSGDHQVYATVEHGVSDYFFWRHPAPGPVISNDGHFNAFTWGKNLYHYQQNSRTPYPAYWKLSSPGAAATQQEDNHRLYHNQEPSLRWGGGYPMYDPEGRDYDTDEDMEQPYTTWIYAPNLLPAPSFTPTNLAIQPGGSILAIPSAQSSDKAQVFIDGAWKPSPTYADAIDVSADGTAIGKAHNNLIAPICINGKWNGIEKAAPGLPLPWKDGTVNLIDTTPGGWILARKGSGSGVNPKQYAVMLPIKVDGVDPDLDGPPLNPPEYLMGGVDHTSMAATGGNGRVPEIWIMAPTGANKAVRFQNPLNPISKLTIPSSFNFEFTPEVIQTNDQTLQVKSLIGSGSYQLPIKLGGTLNSVSSPVSIKAMKRRTVRVAIHPVALKEGQDDAIYPSRIPSNSVEDRDHFKQLLTEYLGKIYGQQVNAFFDIQVLPAVEIDFDTVEPEGEIAINSGNNFTPEMTIACANPLWPSNATDIEVWILGGTDLMDNEGRALGVKIGGTFRATPESGESQTPYILIDGDDSVGRTIAHEMGHIFMGGGHPDLPKQNHFASLTGVSQQARLMKHMEGDQDECQLIKKEWDKIETWLKEFIDK